MVPLLLMLATMSADDRRLLLRMAELLSKTDGCYRDHLAMEIGILEDVARAEGKELDVSDDGARGRVIPFRRSPTIKGACK